jgi:hypothetical protein
MISSTRRTPPLVYLCNHLISSSAAIAMTAVAYRMTYRASKKWLSLPGFPSDSGSLCFRSLRLIHDEIKSPYDATQSNVIMKLIVSADLPGAKLALFTKDTNGSS